MDISNYISGIEFFKDGELATTHIGVLDLDSMIVTWHNGWYPLEYVLVLYGINSDNSAVFHDVKGNVVRLRFKLNFGGYLAKVKMLKSW